MSEGTWFRVALGRKQNADPRWLVPLICKAGGVSKQEIGAIRIFERETKFEIAAHAASAFANAANAQTEARIEPAAPPSSPSRARTQFSERGDFKTKAAPKPYAPKPGGKLSEQQRRRQNKASRH